MIIAYGYHYFIKDGKLTFGKKRYAWRVPNRLANEIKKGMPVLANTQHGYKRVMVDKVTEIDDKVVTPPKMNIAKIRDRL